MAMRNIVWITLGGCAVVAISALFLPKSAGPFVFVAVMLLAALAYFRSNPVEHNDDHQHRR